MDQVPPLTGQYTISAQSVSIDYDPNGNLWYAQYRGAPNEAQPTMKHVSKNSDGEWEEDYSFITDPDNASPLTVVVASLAALMAASLHSQLATLNSQ